jgi:8-oxo-dGTP diphosphatase
MNSHTITVDFLQSEPEHIPLEYVVIVARYNGKWVCVRHKERSTYEVPGGHIEPGEDYIAAAKRELYEETGATDFSLDFISIYTVTTDVKTDGGYLFFSNIKKLSDLPNYEMAEIVLLDNLPENLTYPAIQPHLFKRVCKWMTVRRLEWKRETLTI